MRAQYIRRGLHELHHDKAKAADIIAFTFCCDIYIPNERLPDIG